MAIESEFIRTPLAFEREFGSYRNWWVRNARLSGRPISLLLYLLSHDVQFKISRAGILADLGWDKNMYLRTRRVLEEMGFLVAHEYRHAAGTRDAQGKPIGGHRYITFELADPAEPAKVRVKASAHIESRPFPAPIAVFGPAEQTSLDAALITYSERESAEPSAQNPGQALVPLKEDQSLKENKSSSDVVVHSPEPSPRVSAARAAEDDFSLSGLSTAIDDVAAAQLAALHPELTMPGLVARLLGGGVFTAEAIRAIDLVRAADEILAASKRAVWRPADYIAAALEREPFRWLRSVAAVAGTGGCAELGHRWIGPWNEACARCDEEREGWRDDRDTFPAGLPVIRQAIA